MTAPAPCGYRNQEGEFTLGFDNGSAFTARRFRARLADLGVRHRRGGYRDPESQAFIESGIGGYVDRYHHRPHSA